MKICAAQTKPATGNIQANVEDHVMFIEKAVSLGADVIVFSELSLTGYEPALAKKLATNANDPRLDIFQKLSDSESLTIGVGLPTVNGQNVSISMVILQPGKERLVYSKRYLHPDEDGFFVPGKNFSSLNTNGSMIGPAICYELSIPEHSSAAHECGASVYIASVAKFARGVENAVKTLSDIARKYSMAAIMVNAVGPADNGICTGNSSVWDSRGKLTGQLNSLTEGILIYDTETEEVIEKTVKN